MAIELGRNFVSTPNVKWRAIGQTYMGVLVDMTIRQSKRKNQQTNQWELAWKDAEKTVPKNEMVLTLLTLKEHTTTPVGTERTGDLDAEDLQLVQWTISGKLWSQWIELEGKLREQAGRGISVGDIIYGRQFGCVFYRQDGTVIGTTTSQDEANAQRLKPGGGTVGADIELSLRAAEASELPLVEMAEREYMKRQQRTELGGGQQEERAPVQSATGGNYNAPSTAPAPAPAAPPATSARKFI